MSGHLRFCFAALVLAGLSTSPAYSNPFSFLFNAAPEEATAPAPAEKGCLPQPGKSADGQHWVYRLDGHRKCWFQVAEGVTVRKPVHHHAAKHRVAAAEENEAALRKRKAIVDARGELPRSPIAEMSERTPPAREFKLADAAPVPATQAAALVPPPPVLDKPGTDLLTPGRSAPGQVDVETLLAAAPSPTDPVPSSVVPAAPVAVPTAAVSDDGKGWPASWLGMLLIGLGLVSLFISTGSFCGPLLVGRSLHRPDQETQRDQRTGSIPPPWSNRKPVRAVASHAQENARRNARPKLRRYVAEPQWIRTAEPIPAAREDRVVKPLERLGS